MSTTPPSPQPAAPQTYNQKMLAQIQAVLAGKLLDGVAMYKIGTRELTNIPLPELMKAEAYYEARVRNEIRRSKGLGQRFVPVIFGSAEQRERPDVVAVALVLGAIFLIGLACWRAATLTGAR